MTRERAPHLGGLVSAVTLNAAASTLMIYGLGSLAPFLTAEFGLSRAQLGGIPVTLWVLAGILAPLLGPTVDLLGGRVLLQLTFLCAGAGFVVLGTADSLGVIMVAAGVSSVVMALTNPVTNQLIAQHVPPAKVGSIIGVKQAGQSLAGVVMGVVVPPMASAFGWRAAALGTAAIAPIGMTLTWAVLRRVSRPIVGTLDWRRVRALWFGEPGPRTARRTEFRWLLAYAACNGAGMALVLTYLPLYAHERLGFAEGRAGVLTGLAAAGGIFGRVLWGRVMDRAPHPPVVLAALAGGAALSLLMVLAADVVHPGLIWPAAALFGCTGGSWAVVGAVSVVRIVEPNVLGRASGLLQTTTLFGVMSSPVLFGMTVDRTGHYGFGWAGATATFCASVAVALSWRRWRSRQPVEELSGSPA